MTRIRCQFLVSLLVLLANRGFALGGGFDRAIESVLPRVVKLYGLCAGMQAGYGTGVLVSPDGLVLTVYSLLIEAQRVRALDSKGRLLEAMVVASDPQRQLTLLRLSPIGNLIDETAPNDGSNGPRWP